MGNAIAVADSLVAAMFRFTVRRLAQRVASSASENPYLANNPHRARKVWPPDFSQLTPQQQLRLEKKHKRRVALAHRNPRWDRGVRLVRFLSIVACFIVLTFGAEYRFWGSDYVYKPTEELWPKIGRLFGLMDPDKKFNKHPDLPPEAKKLEPKPELEKKA